MFSIFRFILRRLPTEKETLTLTTLARIPSTIPCIVFFLLYSRNRVLAGESFSRRGNDIARVTVLIFLSERETKRQ